MNAKDRGRMYLSSRIILDARLMSSMRSVRSRLSSYPAMRQVSTGTRLSYLIEGEGNDEKFHTLELEAGRVILTTNSSSSPTYLMKDSLLKILSISMVLSEDYEIDLRGLLPYLTLVLSSSEMLLRDSGPANFNRNADILLSKRVIELINQKNVLEASAARLRSGLISSISALIICKYGKGFTPAGMSKELRVGQEVIDGAIDSLRSRGYRIISSKNGNLEVVGP